MKSAADIARYSPLTAISMKVFELLKCLSIMVWLGKAFPLFRPRSKLTDAEIKDHNFVARRSRAIDYYVISYFATELAISLMVCFIPSPLPLAGFACVLLVVCLRISEIIQVTVNASVFDTISGVIGHRVATTERMLVLAAINFIELFLCFGIVYALNCNLLSFNSQSVTTPATAFYFSAITQLTIGYGDISPTGWLRFLAPLQGFLAFVFVALIFTRFISSMKPMEAVLADADKEKKH